MKHDIPNPDVVATDSNSNDSEESDVTGSGCKHEVSNPEASVILPFLQVMFGAVVGTKCLVLTAYCMALYKVK